MICYYLGMDDDELNRIRKGYYIKHPDSIMGVTLEEVRQMTPSQKKKYLQIYNENEFIKSIRLGYYYEKKFKFSDIPDEAELNKIISNMTQKQKKKYAGLAKEYESKQNRNSLITKVLISVFAVAFIIYAGYLLIGINEQGKITKYVRDHVVKVNACDISKNNWSSDSPDDLVKYYEPSSEAETTSLCVLTVPLPKLLFGWDTYRVFVSINTGTTYEKNSKSEVWEVEGVGNKVQEQKEGVPTVPEYRIFLTKNYYQVTITAFHDNSNKDNSEYTNTAAKALLGVVADYYMKDLPDNRNYANDPK